MEYPSLEHRQNRAARGARTVIKPGQAKAGGPVLGGSGDAIPGA
jgi:hypothetical protein